MDRIEIYTSKKKSILMFIGSVAFVVIAIWLTSQADQIAADRARSPYLIYGIGIAAILFFGVAMIMSMKRVFTRQIVLILDPAGLNVNPRKSKDEYIKWSEITGFDEIKIHSTRILIIGVKNPDYWIEKETSRFKRQLMKLNMNNYNSPFNISATGLDITSDELNRKLTYYMDKYKGE